MAIQVNFPKEGGQSAFTYSFSDCVGSPDVVFDQTTYTWIALNKTTTQVTISASQVPASQITPRSGRVNIKVDGTTCENYFEVSQAGNICDCSTAIITGVSTVTIPQSGGTNIEVGRYTADTNCVTISATGSSDQSWLTNVTLANGIVKANLEPNTTASPRSSTVTIGGTMKNDSSVCTKTILVTQLGLGCSCDDMQFNTSVSWSPEDGGVSTRINVVTSSNNCINCNDITYNSLQHFTVQKDGCNIYVYPNSQNTTRSNYEEILTISYTSNTTPCSSAITLTQLGVDCNCESIKSHIELYNYGDPTPVTIPTGVVTASTTVVCPLSERFVLAKADVQDCGTVHVSSTDTLFFNGGVNFDTSSSEIYCNGILNQGWNSGTYFINTHSAEKECTQITVNVRCGSAPTSCTCSDVSRIEMNSEASSIPCDLDGTIHIFDQWTVKSCLSFKVDTNTLPEWISSYGDDTIWACPNTGEERSATINFDVIKDNTETCVTSSVTVTQIGGCPTCTCRNMPNWKLDGDGTKLVSQMGGSVRLTFTPDGGLPFSCKYERGGSCTYSETPRVTISPRITYYNETGWITNPTTGKSSYMGEEYFYIDVYVEPTESNRLGTVYADYVIDGVKCSNTLSGYHISQEYIDFCSCENAISWFDGETEPVKEVDSSVRSVTWYFRRDYYCTSRLTLDVVNWMSCEDFDITGSTITTSYGYITGITASFDANISPNARECSFAKVRIIKDPEKSTSAVCKTYTLSVRQKPCSCDEYSMGYEYSRGFTDCDGSYGYDDKAWYAYNKGTVAKIAEVNIPDVPCVSLTCEVSSNDDMFLTYFNAYLESSGGKYNVMAEVLDAPTPPTYTSMRYKIKIIAKNGSTECDSTTSHNFVLYKECECDYGKCSKYDLSSNITSVSTSVTTSDGTVIATIDNLPTDSCLEVRTEVQDTNNHAEIRGNNIVAWGYRNDDAFTVFVRLYYYDTDSGTWNKCSGGEVQLPLHVI